jgi:sugar phosphate isomerase/epimerase
MKAGFHNHLVEFVKVGDKHPMQVLADNTPKDFTLQLDVGTCVEAGVDPIAWINANPGRITSLHLKEWASGTGPDKGFRTIMGEGDVPWKKLFAAAESKGGVEFYLIEQEGSRFSEMESAERSLAEYKKIHG